MRSFSPVCVNLVSFLLLLSIQDALGQPLEKKGARGADGLQGIWLAVSVEGGGVSGSEKLWVVITAKTLAIRVNNKVIVEASYSLDPTRTPTAIDLKSQGHDTPGVYELDGDTLKLCLGSDNSRPAKFVATDATMLLVLKRQQYKLVRSPGPGLAEIGKPLPDVAVAVLDDCDPNFKGDGPHGDGIRLLSREGKQLFALSGLNNCQTVGANHAVVIDAKRGRVYFRQLVARRVTALDFSGNTLFEVHNFHAHSLAVDPATGYVWCLANQTGMIYGEGETVVLNDRGELVASYPIDGFDIAHDPKTDTFWIVGKSIVKLDRRGEVVFRQSPGGWVRVSVAVNPRDGSAWIAERQHPDVRGSAALVLHLDSEGNELHRIDFPGDPFCVACDPETGTAWVVDRSKAILRIGVGAQPLGRLDLAAKAVAIGPETGQIWASTENEVLHLDKQGKPVARYPLGKPSGQSWIAVR